MFRACKPSVPRPSIEKAAPTQCPPPAVKPTAQPLLQCFNTQHQLVNEKSEPTEAMSKENEQPSASQPQQGTPCQMGIESLEMGWEYRTILEPALTPEDMSEDLSREIRPERIVHPDDDPLLQDMFALFSDPQPKQ